MKRWQKVFVAVLIIVSAHWLTMEKILDPGDYMILAGFVAGFFFKHNMDEKKLKLNGGGE